MKVEELPEFDEVDFSNEEPIANDVDWRGKAVTGVKN